MCNIDVFKSLTLYNIRCHESSSVIITLKVTSGQVPPDLETEQVSGVLLLQLAGVGDVELHHEPQHGLV